MKEEKQIFRIDGIKWWVSNATHPRLPVPLCPDHNLRMTPYAQYNYDRGGDAYNLQCAEGPHVIRIPRKFRDEKRYVLDSIDARIFKEMEFVDIDGELTPIIKKRVTSEDEKYFVEIRMKESKKGLQVVVYAGEKEKGKKEKTQIFIDPKHKRLSFDQKDLHPNDIFLELKATFDDGSVHTMKKSIKKKTNDK